MQAKIYGGRSHIVNKEHITHMRALSQTEEHFRSYYIVYFMFYVKMGLVKKNRKGEKTMADNSQKDGAIKIHRYQHYLLLMTSFSRYPEVIRQPSTMHL